MSPEATEGGGYLDSFIESFHDSLGLGQSNRDDYPQDMFQIDFQFDDGSSYQTSQTGNDFYREDATVFIQVLCTKGGDRLPAVSVGVAAKLTGRADDSVSDGVDYGVYCSLSKKVRDFYFYGTASSIRVGEIPEDFYILKQNRLNLSVACEWRFKTSSSLLLQYTMGGAVAEDYYELSKESHEITIGYKKRFGTWMMECGLLENAIFFENSPDVGFHFGMSFLF